MSDRNLFQCVLLLASCAFLFSFSNGETIIAQAHVYSVDPENASETPQTPIGSITFTQIRGEPEVTITGSLEFDPIPDLDALTGRGFHIHEHGSVGHGCKDAGAHYNPTNASHGGPTNTTRHVGDLGNVWLYPESGMMNVSITDTVIQLYGEHSIIGRAVVVHNKTDNLGELADNPDSRKTGASGNRIACGVIGIISDDYKTAAGAGFLANPTVSVYLISITCILIAFSKY